MGETNVSKLVKFLIFFALILIIQRLATSQIVFPSGQNALNIYSIPYFQSWTLKGESEQKVTQVSIPIFLNINPSENLSLWLSDSAAFSKLKGTEAGSIDLNGLSDVKLKCSYSMLTKRIIATLGANLPTGKSELKCDQLVIANMMYDEALGFKANRLGSGFELNPGIAILTGGSSGIGLALSYTLRGSYESIEDTGKYDPGDTLNLMVLSTLSIKSLMGNANLTYVHYADDKLNDTKAFKQGDEIRTEALLAYKTELFILAVSAIDVVRMKNKVLSADGTLTAERFNRNGNRLEMSATGQLFLTRNLAIVPTIGFMSRSKNGYKQDDAFVFNIGQGLLLSFGNSSLSISLKLFSGSMDDGDVKVSGTEIGILSVTRF